LWDTILWQLVMLKGSECLQHKVSNYLPSDTKQHHPTCKYSVSPITLRHFVITTLHTSDNDFKMNNVS